MATVTIKDANQANVALAVVDLSTVGGVGDADVVQVLEGRPVCVGSAFGVAITTATFDGTGLSVPANATHLYFSVEGNDVRMREDGTSPTAANGVRLPVGGPYLVPLPATHSDLRLIPVTGTATLNISYRSARS